MDREILIALLQDEYGISKKVWDMISMCHRVDKDILKAVYSANPPGNLNARIRISDSAKLLNSD